jgi:hypothetical protein
MGKWDKLVARIYGGRNDANISFEELCGLLVHFGFELHIRGSHHLFRKIGVVEKINLQKDGSQAKAYQVRQVRDVILKYQLGGDALHG